MSSGILTLIGNESPGSYENVYRTKLVVQNGGTLFAEGATLEEGLTVEVGGFAQRYGATLYWDLYDEADNSGTLIVRDSLLEGSCPYKDGGVFYNSGRLVMEHVTFWAGCYDRFPNAPVVTGMQNTGVVSMTNVTYFGAGTLCDGPEAGYLLAGIGLYEASNSIFDRGETDRICSAAGAPVQIVDLGHNVFNSLEHCLVDVQAGTSLEAEPGTIYLGGELELGPGSPGIDFIPLEECRSYDRLGRPRTDGDGVVACDAGALEFSGTAISVKSPPFWLGYGELDLATDKDLYVALMSNPAFDPADVVVESVVFGDTDALPRGWNYVDRNKDLVPDLRLRYRLWDVDLACGRQEIEVSASTTDGRVVAGVLKLDVTGCSF